MKFSLITATLGRVEEFEKLLLSLSSQTFNDFELIVVDQNEHRLLEEICSKFHNLNIKYIRSNKKGLSLNRNVGLKYATGEILGFPDDDCFYDNNLLETVVRKFQEPTEYKLVAVEAKDIINNQVFIKKIKRDVTRYDLYKHFISFNFFIKKVGTMTFDENLGVGAKFGSGEETDFLLEYFLKNDKGTYVDGTFVNHPSNINNGNIQRAYKYGLGFGALFKKEIFIRKKFNAIFFYLWTLLRSIGGILFKKQKQFYYNSLKGRIEGFIVS